jgi:methionyl-tRNA synthetase
MSLRRTLGTLSVTTPVFYVNASPHIGHAYSMVLADAISRWNYVRGGTKSQLFTGTDEYGQKVYEAAKAADTSPTIFTTTVSARFRELAKVLHVELTRFIRTTDYDHQVAVQHLWRRLVNSGDIYQGAHAGWYCISEEAFYPEHELSFYDGRKVVKATGKLVTWVEEASYMFRLTKYREQIREWLGSAIIPSSRFNGLREYLSDPNLFKDISVSRKISTAKWGIPVPDDPEQLIYVWLDALTNYLTCTGYPSQENTPDIHVIGKDILKFHAVYWPAFLLAAKLPLPKQLICHGHWTRDGTKMSKSLGNTVDPMEVVEQFGVDAVRYFLLKNSKLDGDADFDDGALVRTVNTELVNQLGNLLSRAFTPRFLSAIGDQGAANPSANVKGIVFKVLEHSSASFDRHDFGVGLETLQSILQSANRLFSEAEPWNLLETDPSLIRQTLSDVAYMVTAYCIALQPVAPILTTKALDMLRVDARDLVTFKDVCRVDFTGMLTVTNRHVLSRLEIPIAH